MTTRERILPPYTRRVDDLRHRLVQLSVAMAVLLLAVVFGFFIGVFGTFGWFIPAIPTGILALVALWVAPDVDTDVDSLIVRLYFCFMAVLLVWPPYIAFNAPGLPWISLQRIAMFVLAAVAAFALATSARLRGEFVAPLRMQPVLTQLFLFWVGWSTLMLAVGQFSGVSTWAKQQFMWTFMFLVSAWFATRAGNARILMAMILVAAAITAAVVIPEARDMKPIWADHIPSFLSIDPSVLDALQNGVARFGEYRARSIFRNSLTYAEYLGMVIPFSLLAISWARNQSYRVAACGLLLLLITAGTLTQARSAMAAMVAAIPMFAGLWIWRRYRDTRHRNDIIAPAMLAAFPFAALTLMVLILVHPRVHTMVLGGAGTQSSTDARKSQWVMAIPEMIKNPVGHGMGSVSSVVPYRNMAGVFTIDSYPINLLIEYGVPGFLAFVGFFALAAGIGIHVYLHAKTDDEQVAGAAAIGIISFMITRTILSSEGGQGLAFGFAGIIVGLWYRQKQREAAARKVAPPVAPPPASPPRQLWRPLAGPRTHGTSR